MPDIWGLAAITIKFAFYLGVCVSAGTVFVAMMFEVMHIRLLTAIFASLGLIATVIGFSLGGATLTGDVHGMIDLEMRGLLWRTTSGSAMAYRLTGLVLIIQGTIPGRSGIWMSAIGAVLSLRSFTTIRHISSREIAWLNMILLIHLIAIAIALWIGILTPLKRLTDMAAGQKAAEREKGRCNNHRGPVRVGSKRSSFERFTLRLNRCGSYSYRLNEALI